MNSTGFLATRFLSWLVFWVCAKGDVWHSSCGRQVSYPNFVWGPLFDGADGRRYFVVGCLKLKNELSVILYTLVEVSGRLISVTEE